MSAHASTDWNTALAGTLFAGKVQWFERVESTNQAALELAALGAEEGTVILAGEQTAGRGRGGHSWHSAPDDGIYCSAVLRPQLAGSEILLLSFIAGFAVREAVALITGAVADLRWPNDLLLGGRKFAGILTEVGGSAEARYAVVGIGVNVNHAAFPAELAGQATSLRLHTGREWPRQALAAALLQSLGREYARLRELPTGERARQLCARFEQLSSYARGKAVHVAEDGGYSGVTEGLDERGFLRVRTAAGLRSVISGGVRPLGMDEEFLGG